MGKKIQRGIYADECSWWLKMFLPLFKGKGGVSWWLAGWMDGRVNGEERDTLEGGFESSAFNFCPARGQEVRRRSNRGFFTLLSMEHVSH